VDTAARLVAVVPSWELPHLAGIDFDTLDFAIRFAHTYIRCSKDNTCRFEDCNTGPPVGEDIGQGVVFAVKQGPKVP